VQKLLKHALPAARCERSLHTSKLTSEARAGPTRNAVWLSGSRLASKQEASWREAGVCVRLVGGGMGGG
jgi:hypothetical protein